MKAKRKNASVVIWCAKCKLSWNFTLCSILNLIRNLLKYQDWQGQIHKMRLYYHLSVSVPSVCVYSEVSEMISTVPLKSISLPWDGKTWRKGAIPQSKKHYMSAKYSGQQLATPSSCSEYHPSRFFYILPSDCRHMRSLVFGRRSWKEEKMGGEMCGKGSVCETNSVDGESKISLWGLADIYLGYKAYMEFNFFWQQKISS